MKKIQTILGSFKTQDKGSVKHSSISSPQTEEPQDWILANPVISIAPLCPSLNSHIHHFLCTHPLPPPPPNIDVCTKSFRKHFIKISYVKMVWLNLKEEYLYLYILSTLGKLRKESLEL